MVATTSVCVSNFAIAGHLNIGWLPVDNWLPAVSILFARDLKMGLGPTVIWKRPTVPGIGGVWVVGEKQDLKSTESENRTWRIPPIIGGYKFVGEGLMHLPSTLCQPESFFVRNILDNAVCTIISNCILFWGGRQAVSFGKGIVGKKVYHNSRF